MTMGDANRSSVSRKQQGMEYEQTVVYGQYHKRPAISSATRKQSREILDARKQSKLEAFCGALKETKCCTKCDACNTRFCGSLCSRINEDWVFLCILGIIMALLSYGIDYIILQCNDARIWLYGKGERHVLLQYFIWVSFTLAFIIFSVMFTQVVAPNAIGSGIPEMKTILRGVPLHEYLTFRTLVAKVVGLCTALGSGMPLGKEGPFVHIASIVATLMSKISVKFRGLYEEESRNSEMLAAACAVGVACTFAAPIGGVLFSIEVTSAYFAVKNYWRGFFAAVCSATVFRVLAILSRKEETVTALFRTTFPLDYPFDVLELFVFALMGVACGLAGALFVYLHRKTVLFLRRKRVKNFLMKNRTLYPALIVLLATSMRFPHGLGQYFAGQLTFHRAIEQFFANYTWSENLSQRLHAEELQYWLHVHGNVFISLTLFVIVNYILAVLANTLAVPAGVFVPVFTIGAAFGRLVGEVMYTAFPEGIKEFDNTIRILPGGYAVVGAAALSGAVTHTVSTAIIVFELTGQIQHILPAVIAVLISNAVAHGLQPSIYDSIIRLKALPYMPSISADKQTVSITASQIMAKDVKFVSHDMTYNDVSELIQETTYKMYPLVDNKASMILLGSIPRNELFELLEDKLTRADISVAGLVSGLHQPTIATERFNNGPTDAGLGNIAPDVRVVGASPPLSPELRRAEHGASTSTAAGAEVDTPNSIEQSAGRSVKIGRFSVAPISEKQQAAAASAEARDTEVDEHESRTSGKSREDESRPSREGRGSDKLRAEREARVNSESRPSEEEGGRGKARASSDLNPDNKTGEACDRQLSFTPGESVRLKPIMKRSESLDCVDEGRKRGHFKRRMTTDDLLSVERAASGYSDTEQSFTSSLYGTIRKFLKKVQLAISDHTQQQRAIPVAEEEWEREQLMQVIDCSDLQIDPSPFQLVEQTSLYKIHKIFTLLNLELAYVTNLGRLVGVVGMKEIREVLTSGGQVTPLARQLSLATKRGRSAGDRPNSGGLLERRRSVDIELSFRRHCSSDEEERDATFA